MNKVYQILSLIALVALLISVRFFQNTLFYDPLNDYFHGNFQSLPFPDLNLTLLLISNALRYLLNSAISIAVLWVLFHSRNYIKAGLWVYLFAFLLLNILFLIALQFEMALSKMALFYTRRFLIHPLLLFVLVAGGFFLRTRAGVFTTDSGAPYGEQ